MTPTVKDIANLPVDKLPPLVHVPPVTKPFDVTIRPPGSKSLTNRALLLAALAEGESVLTGALADADDAQVMVRALRQLGAEIEVTPEVEANGESCGNATIRVKGVGGRWKIKPGETVTLNLNNAGTATRFLAAAAVLQPSDSGGIVIDGNARMRERPIKELVDVLRKLGADATYLDRAGHLPVRIGEPRRPAERPVIRFGATQSSQFISAVMLTASWLPFGVEIRFDEEPTSSKYVDMTSGMLARVCAKGAWSGEGWRSDRWKWPLIIDNCEPGLSAFDLEIEADATGASALFAASPLVAHSRVSVRGLPTHPHGGLQGDTEFALFCAAIGGDTNEDDNDGKEPIFVAATEPLRAVDWGVGHMPDTAMSAAVVASFAMGESVLRGVKTLRVKETDRIAALVTELAKVGVTVEPFAYSDANGHPDEGIRITPPPGGIDCSPSAPRVEFDTYDDHRMAMSLALIGLRRPNIYIRDPGCVRKTYPTFWRDLAKLYG